MPFWRKDPTPTGQVTSQTPAAHTPYDPTHVWVYGPNGDVLTNVLTGKPAVPGDKIPVPAGVPVASFVASIPVVSAPATPVAVIAAPAAKESIMSIFTVIKADGVKLLSVMEAIGQDAAKGLVVVAKYLPQAAALAELLFPAEAPAIAAGTSVALNVTNLIQNAVAEVEAKAKLIPAGLTGAQMSADVLQLVSQTVIADLATLKITAGTSYVQSLVNAICAILNIPETTAATA